MKNYLNKINAIIQQNYGISLQTEDLKKIDAIVITGNQSNLLQIEGQLCQAQKQNCIDQLHLAFDKYHHESMNTEEIKTIVSNVLNNRAPTPEITDTVRLLLKTT